MRSEKRWALGAGIGWLALLALMAGIAACRERIVVGTELVDEPGVVVSSGADGGAEASPADDEDEESGDEDEESDEDDEDEDDDDEE